MLKIAIVGVGTVGTSVVNILKENQKIISARAGKEIVPVIGVVQDMSKKRDVDIQLTDDIQSVLEDDSVDIIVELMGGIEKPFEVVKQALKKGKAVVTANKALLAYHRYELQDAAKETPFEFEAAVAGGIPIINALREGLSANHIQSIAGIINGTCNYMLTKMIEEGVAYKDILKEAQELGYAEADPTFDVGGFDAAHKLLILASIAYGIDAKPEDILIEGIEFITQDDIDFAKDFEYSIKLLAIAKKKDEEVELRVHPVMIATTQMISKVDGVMNGVSVIGDKVGETMYYGPGAGGDATASAVIANIIDIARGGKRAPMLGFTKPLESGLALAKTDSIQTKYYLRIKVLDKPGVLSQVSSILGDRGISIEKLIQRPLEDGYANLLLTTHMCIQKDIDKAIEELESDELVALKPVMIRIQE